MNKYVSNSYEYFFEKKNDFSTITIKGKLMYEHLVFLTVFLFNLIGPQR